MKSSFDCEGLDEYLENEDDIYDEIIKHISSKYPRIPLSRIGITILTHITNDLTMYGGWSHSELIEMITPSYGVDIFNDEIGGMTMN